MPIRTGKQFLESLHDDRQIFMEGERIGDVTTDPRFAGAARELDTALIINPFDVDQIVDALDRALGMPIEERRARYEAMMSWLQEHDVHVWRESFLKALQQPPSMLLPGRPTVPVRRTRHGALSNA